MKRRWLDRALQLAGISQCVYYVFIVGVGVATLCSDEQALVVDLLGSHTAAILFGLEYAVLGVAALVFRRMRAGAAESAVIFGIAAFTAIHGVLLFLYGSEISGARLVAAFFMMASYAVVNHVLFIVRLTGIPRGDDG